MMDKNTENTTQKVLDNIWNAFNQIRGKFSVEEAFNALLYVMYGYHKQYQFVHASDVNHSRMAASSYFRYVSDSLLTYLALNATSPLLLKSDDIIDKLYTLVSAVNYFDYEAAYPVLLEQLFSRVAACSGRSSSEFFTPSEINALISYFVHRDKSATVFDPFCGTASICRYLGSSIPFKGQEYNENTAIYARLNSDAVYGSEASSISWCNSITEWNSEHFDAVISCPPFGLIFNEDETAWLQNCRQPANSVEEILFRRAFENNSANTVIALLHTGFGVSSVDKDLRKYLIDNDYLDTIIALPNNLLYGTSVQCMLVVCSKHKETPRQIKFIDASSCYDGERRRDRRLNVAAVIDAIEGRVPELVGIANPEEIYCYKNYNLNPHLYISANEKELKDGQEIVRLSTLITEKKFEFAKENIQKKITPHETSNDFIDILRRKNDFVTESEPNCNKKIIRCSKGEKYVVVFEGRENKFSLQLSEENFIISSMVKAFLINTDKVLPEYLVLKLINDPIFGKTDIPISSCLERTLVIDSLDRQAEIVNGIIQEYYSRVSAEREADDLRLGVQRNVSDLEHMLGSTQFRIDRILKRIEAQSHDEGSLVKGMKECLNQMDDNSAGVKNDLEQIADNLVVQNVNNVRTIKALRDNVEYMNRVIKYSNALISPQSFNKINHVFTKFLLDYSDGWSNYGGNYFSLEIKSTLPGGFEMSFDDVMLTVMLDAILSNAVRHGFKKNKNYTERNLVEISTTAVNYKGRPYVILRIANNGDPFKDGFTIDDYVSRGRYTSETGRSGLGGYHVHQIAKGHNGYVSLDSNKIWNTIVEVLLPIEGEVDNNMEVYERECL